jgi:hypothetical protein
VGLALKRTKSQTSIAESEDDFQVLDEDGETFKEIMSMLMDCLD